MLQSSKLPVRGRKSLFHPTGVTRCTNSHEIWHGQGAHGYHLAVQNFMPIGAQVWERGQKK